MDAVNHCNSHEPDAQGVGQWIGRELSTSAGKEADYILHTNEAILCLHKDAAIIEHLNLSPHHFVSESYLAAC